MPDSELLAFDHAWGRLRAWLAQNSTVDHAALRTPATENDLARLEKEALIDEIGTGFGRSDSLGALLRDVADRLERGLPAGGSGEAPVVCNGRADGVEQPGDA
ncbi:hypothetical protein ACFXGT_19510 [Streptomyces sp. NPDC059352]|uniref:hypothetical protein n=1 Tax=Streptomyces sp. NPDC059352 TaxID=3346810 RepID=UPI0036CAD782